LGKGFSKVLKDTTTCVAGRSDDEE
jgi:hypothetical protein